LATDFKNVPIYIYGYQDKFKALPGDDANVQVHLGASAVQAPLPPGGTAGNGIINGKWYDAANWTGATTDESYLFWQHIRMAGFGPGSTDPTQIASYLPTNAVGGHIGVTNASAADKPINGMVGTYIVCSDSIPFKFAKQLDVSLDDGNTATGSVMVTTAGTPSGGAPIPTSGTGTVPDDTPVLVCMGY
ncbi:MAG: prepilin-type cleavage/methylation domain-containing protein, partial [Gallionella sp.]|nr:prepilin-type cleavage/methylation domain-containing protein [Gallionella sp.]